ncbi:hypothetical protein [Pseudophaeobacter arcticus]|jgi:hypothetical protein|uniref:hypothetical protein n=1 Tax=Pseudophaeobacter arcticus TaxID=385492 RepID=UPI0004851E2A|nr:hypothetical protein [Pseudophaeobacter arcticus]
MPDLEVFGLNRLNVFVVIALCLVVQGCSQSSTGGENFSVNFGQTKVYWKDFLEVSEMHRGAVQVAPGESIYMFGAVTAASVKMPDGAVVTSEQGCIQRASDYSGTVPVLDSSKYYDCKRRLDAAKTAANQRSFSQLLSMAERAVQEEGSCSWKGYDRQLDQEMRAIGRLARADDQRIFFAKMTCNN